MNRGSPVLYRSIAACLAGLALAACGSQSPAAPPAASRLPAGLTGPAATAGPADASLAGLHACALVPAATATLILGPLTGPCYGPQNGTGTLAFYDLSVPGDPADGRATVSLTIIERSGFDASQSFAAGVGQSGAAQVRSVPGLGASAFSISPTSDGGPDYQLWAAVGGRGVEIDINSTAPADEARVRELMKAALVAL
jgi:hypothetical protein